MTPRGQDDGDPLFAAGGEMGRLIRSHDWASTTLGSPETWPQALRTAVSIMLDSRYAMWMAWGPDLDFFCNDAYRPTSASRPAGRWVPAPIRSGTKFGLRSAHASRPCSRPAIATWDEDLLLFLERSGYPEETYHTFSYSPLRDDGGAIAGMLCVVTEETERVIGERRLLTLRQLADLLSTATDRGWRRSSGRGSAGRQPAGHAVQPALPLRRGRDIGAVAGRCRDRAR